MSLEQEIKLLVNSDEDIDLALLTTLMTSVNSDVEHHHLVSTYYDTPDLYLRKQKLGLRLRQIDDTWCQTVKTAGVVKDGLHQRDEWEYALKEPTWDLDTLRQTPLSAMIDDEELWLSLAPLFTTDFIRESVQITLADESQVELAYDHGEVRAGAKVKPIHEIELELKSGSVGSLTFLVKELAQHSPLSPSNISKAQLGYQLIS